MAKFSSLIVLINSLSKSERKKITAIHNLSDEDTDYIALYKIIIKHPLDPVDSIKEKFLRQCPHASLNTSVSFLFKNLLSNLTQLRTSKDNFFRLFDLLMKAKILFEKSIYHECFRLLAKIENEAEQVENFQVLLIALKLELDYLLILDFPDISEKELLNKQLKINETIKKIRKINEHASLYELLKYRILHLGAVKSSKQKSELSDLVVSEMSIISSSTFDNFEIHKNHKLFQSYYLTNVGDYRSALSSFYELNNVFEQNMHLLAKPPIYYLMTIEGVLESLRAVKKYDSMTYFIDQLEKMQANSNHFKAQLQCVVFLYQLFPLLDTGRFAEAKALIDNNKKEIYDKYNLLTPVRQAQLFLNTAIVYIGTREFAKARKLLSQIMMLEKTIFALPLYRTIRLVNLIILYEIKEFDYIDSEVRSVKREIQNNSKVSIIEYYMLKFVRKSMDGISKAERLKLWEKYSPDLMNCHNDKYELQLLNIFDFTAWIEAKIKELPLASVLMERTK